MTIFNEEDLLYILKLHESLTFDNMDESINISVKNVYFPPKPFNVSAVFLHLQIFYARIYTPRWHCTTNHYKDSGEAFMNDNGGV